MVAVRPSSDWPICPTTTRSSTRPARRGPKMLSQRGGASRRPERIAVSASRQPASSPASSWEVSTKLMEHRAGTRRPHHSRKLLPGIGGQALGLSFGFTRAPDAVIDEALDLLRAVDIAQVD